MSYGLLGSSGTSVSSAASSRSGSSLAARRRRVVEVVARQVGEQLADRGQAGGVVGDGEVADAALGGVGARRRRAPPW